jgi:hypothetical protein
MKFFKCLRKRKNKYMTPETNLNPNAQDATAFIQSHLDDANVVIPKGYYKIDGTLAIRSARELDFSNIVL